MRTYHVAAEGALLDGVGAALGDGLSEADGNSERRTRSIAVCSELELEVGPSSLGASRFRNRTDTSLADKPAAVTALFNSAAYARLQANLHVNKPHEGMSINEVAS